MKSINTRAIVGHLEKTLGSLPEMSGVSWRCQNGTFRCEYITNWDSPANAHGAAHEFVYDLVSRSNGNFLWLSLVTDTILRLSKMGMELAGIRKDIVDLPDDLDTYFRKAIIERGDKKAMRVTAMALSISLLPGSGNSWLPFWLLINSINGKAPSLEQPEFARKAPYHLCEHETVKTMMQNTESFIGESCRDILDTSVLRDSIDHAEDQETTFYRSVSFTHRTIYDFLQTREMQGLLDKHTPSTFRDRYFHARIVIACAKVRLKPGSASSTEAEMRFTKSLLDPVYNWVDFTYRLCDLRETGPVEDEEEFREHESIMSQLAEVMDDIATHDLFESTHWASDVLRETPAARKQLLRNFAFRLFVCLAHYNCYRLVDAFLDPWPKYVLRNGGELLHQILSWIGSLQHLVLPLHAEHQETVTFTLPLNTKLLRKFFVAGADPNGRIEAEGKSLSRAWSTIWCIFLQRLAINERSSTDARERARSPPRLKKEGGLRRKYPKRTFSSPDVQAAIKGFLEFGADLEPNLGNDDENSSDACIDPLATLRKYLPMDADSEWPALLELYLRPKKREEIRESRRKLVGSLSNVQEV